MSRFSVNQNEIVNLPWEVKPESCNDIIWRYSGNPVIPRDLIPGSNSIFNSAVVPYKEGFAGVFRCDNRARQMDIHAGFSDDGMKWELSEKPIVFVNEKDFPESDYKYDPRVIQIENRFFIVWCNGYHGASIGMGYTDDFKTFHKMENPFIPYNRNGVLFPRKIHGNYAILTRPSDSGHTPFGDIFYSESPDLEFWGRHRFVMGTRGSDSGWQSTKIGAGPVPIETGEGWLLFYHGVLTSCNGFVYSMGIALLDLDEPWKVIHRSRPYLMSPQKEYECVGDVPNVVFPCAALMDGKTGRLAIYYGCADTVTGIAFTILDELIPWLRENSL